MAPLYKRDSWCYGYNCSGSTWTWARWILFVLFILALICVVISAIRINKRRSQEGREPIRGTAWITPPSYSQSQHQQRTQNPPYVPQYTETFNDNDLGYYDAQGQFHHNPKTREAYHLNNLVQDETGRDSSTQGVHTEEVNAEPYQAPSGPPPVVQAQAQATPTGTTVDDDLNFNRDFERYYQNYDRPNGPPPAHYKS